MPIYNFVLTTYSSLDGGDPSPSHNVINGKSKDSSANGVDVKKEEKKEFDAELEKQKYLRLTFLLEKTSLYSDFLSQKLNIAIDEKALAEKTIKTNGDTSDNDAAKKRKRNGKHEEVNFTSQSQPYFTCLIRIPLLTP